MFLQNLLSEEEETQMDVDIHGYVHVTCMCVCACVLIYRGNSSYSKCHDQFHTLTGKVVPLMCVCDNVCV